MRTALLLLPLALALASSPAWAQASGEAPGARGPAGLGVVVVVPEEDLALRFYEAPEAIAPVHEVIGPVDAAPPAWLRPDAWWPDYFLFHFRVLETRGEWARVRVHEDTGRSLWVRTDAKARVFEPWGSFFLNHVTIVEREDIAANPVRTAPGAGAPLADLPEGTTEADWGGDCLLPTEVRGDWIRVRRSEMCSPPGDTPPLGWIRWREGDRLLISWGLTC